MKYTKGEWKVLRTDVEPQRFIIDCELERGGKKRYHRSICRMFGYCDTVSEELANANLIAAAVNACIKVNPENPQAVAEALPDLYETLKVIRMFVLGVDDLGPTDKQVIVAKCSLALAKADNE